MTCIMRYPFDLHQVRCLYHHRDEATMNIVDTESEAGLLVQVLYLSLSYANASALQTRTRLVAFWIVTYALWVTRKSSARTFDLTGKL
jgi:hypothetical protein